MRLNVYKGDRGSHPNDRSSSIPCPKLILPTYAVHAALKGKGRYEKIVSKMLLTTNLIIERGNAGTQAGAEDES